MSADGSKMSCVRQFSTPIDKKTGLGSSVSFSYKNAAPTVSLCVKKLKVVMNNSGINQKEISLISPR